MLCYCPALSVAEEVARARLEAEQHGSVGPSLRLRLAILLTHAPCGGGACAVDSSITPEKLALPRLGSWGQEPHTPGM